MFIHIIDKEKEVVVNSATIVKMEAYAYEGHPHLRMDLLKDTVVIHFSEEAQRTYFLDSINDFLEAGRSFMRVSVKEVRTNNNQ